MMNLLTVMANILPPSASNWAEPIDLAFWVVTWICLIAFLLVEGALIVFVFKYRRRRGGQQPAGVEATARVARLDSQCCRSLRKRRVSERRDAIDVTGAQARIADRLARRLGRQLDSGNAGASTDPGDADA